MHKHIQPMVERILIGLDAAGFDVSGAATDEANALRTSFVLPGVDGERVNPLIEAASFRYADGKISFMGTAKDAVEMASAVLAASVETVGDEPPVIDADVPVPEELPAPLSRDLEDEETHRFIQTLTGAQAASDTPDRLREWQARNGVPATGELDDDTWKAILPQRAQWLRPGATGSQIKVLQAAFIVRGYFEGRVDGVWGIEMSRSLRRFQHDYRIHPRLRIGNPEWTALFGERQQPL